MTRRETTEDVCHFCGGTDACYARREDHSGPTSEYFPACEPCARKPYPQPKQFQGAQS